MNIKITLSHHQIKNLIREELKKQNFPNVPEDESLEIEFDEADESVIVSYTTF